MVRIRVVDFEDEEGQSLYGWLERKCNGRMVWNGIPRMISLFCPRYGVQPSGTMILAYQEANGPVEEMDYVPLSTRITRYGTGIKYVWARIDVWHELNSASSRDVALRA